MSGLRRHGELWMQHAAELAPFFTALLRALGAAYGNEGAARGVVTQARPALFVGAAAPGRGVRVVRGVEESRSPPKARSQS
jgi:hypothetical protein